MSSRSTPNTSPTPGSMSRGTPTSTTSSARPPRRCHHLLDRAALHEEVAARRSTRAARRTSTSASGISSSVIARPPTRARELVAPSPTVRLATTISAHARAREREGHALRPSRPRRARARAGRRACRDGSAASATAADDTDTAWRPIAVSVRDALAHLDRVAERARQRRAAGDSALGGAATPRAPGRGSRPRR